MFGVLISYLPNFNVGQENGIINVTGSWRKGTTSTEEPRQKNSINVFGTHMYRT